MAESHREEIAKLEALYASNPNGRVFVHLAEAYRKGGEHERARRILTEGIARHHDSASAYVVLGRVLVDMNETGEAENAFRRVLDLDSGNLIALRNLGDLARLGGRPAEAATHYRELLARSPSKDNVRDLVSLVEEAEAAAAPPPPPTPVAASVAPGKPEPTRAPEPDFGVIDLADLPGDLASFVGLVDTRTKETEATVEMATEGVVEEPSEPLPDFALDVAADSAADTVDPDEALLAIELDDVGETVDDATLLGLAIELDDVGETVDDATLLGLAIETPSAAAGFDVDETPELPRSVDEPAVLDSVAVEVEPEQDDVAAEAVDVELEEPEVDDVAVEAHAGFEADDVAAEAVDVELDDEPEVDDVAAFATSPSSDAVSSAPPPVEAGAVEPVVHDEFLPFAEPAAYAVDAVSDLLSAPAEPVDVEPAEEAGVQERMEDAPGFERAYGDATGGAPSEAGAPPLVTETMAELYSSQGFHDRALEVYRALLAQRPGDERLAARLRAAQEAASPKVESLVEADESGELWLRDAGSAWTASHAEQAEDVSPYGWAGDADEAPAGEPIAALLGSILAWRPAAAPARETAPPAPHEPAAAVEASPSEPDPHVEAPAVEPEPQELELVEEVAAAPARESAAEPPAPWETPVAAQAPASEAEMPWEAPGAEAVPEAAPEAGSAAEPWSEPEPWSPEPAAPEPAAPVVAAAPAAPVVPTRTVARTGDAVADAFSEWFDDATVASPAPVPVHAAAEPAAEPVAEAAPAVEEEAQDDEDLEMFRSWLQSLKK